MSGQPAFCSSPRFRRITEDATVAKEAVGSSIFLSVRASCGCGKETADETGQCEGGGFCTSISDSFFPVTKFCFFPKLFVLRNPRVSGAFEVTRAQKSEAWPRRPRPLRHSLVPLQAPSLSHSAYSVTVALSFLETTPFFSPRSTRSSHFTVSFPRRDAA